MSGPADPELARATGRLLARVAHDLNNVAMVCGGHVHLARGGQEELAEAWSAFDDALANLARLTQRLQELGRLGAAELDAVDLNSVAREAAGPGAEPLELDLDPALPAIRGRAEDLAQALQALIANAREASPRGAPVRLRTRAAAEEGSVVVDIEDSGPGVAEEIRRRGYEPLVSTRGERGRGLGLALARLVALEHGGALEIEDRRQGGTRASLRFPL